MPWLSPEEWVAALGAAGAGFARPYDARGGEEDLAAAIAADPRRLIALVGAPGAGASRLALELARRAKVAWLPDPRVEVAPAEAVAALEQRLVGVGAGERPLVVLDGPDEREALASLPLLVARCVHPRLAVVVPCGPVTAPRLNRIAGDYSRAAILVAAVDGEGGSPPVALPEACLPFALAGRVVAGTIAGEGELCAAGLCARAPDGGTVVCLAGERSREALARALVIDAADGPARLAALLAAHPGLRARSVESLLRWTSGALPEALHAPLLAFGADDALDVLELGRRGIFMSPAVMVAITERLRALVAGGAAVEDKLAVALALGHDADGAIAMLRAGLARELAPLAHARLLLRLAGSTRDADLAAEAVAAARAVDDPGALPAALLQLARLLHGHERRDEAIAACVEAATLDAGRGLLAAAASARVYAAVIAEEAEDRVMARDLLAGALAKLRAVGDTRGQSFALYRLGRLNVDLRDDPAAEAVTRQALELVESIGDVGGAGYVHWVLGAMADRRADPGAAAEHYQASIAAYAQVGPIPDRLPASLMAAQAAAAGMAQTAAPGVPDAPDELPPAPVDQGLVPLGRRPKP